MPPVSSLPTKSTRISVEKSRDMSTCRMVDKVDGWTKRWAGLLGKLCMGKKERRGRSPYAYPVQLQ